MNLRRADGLLIAAGTGCAVVAVGIRALTAAAIDDLVPWTRELAFLHRARDVVTSGFVTLALGLATTGLLRARGAVAAAVCGGWALVATALESLAHPIVRASLLTVPAAERSVWVELASGPLASAHFSPLAALAPTVAAVCACLFIRWSDP